MCQFTSIAMTTPFHPQITIKQNRIIISQYQIEIGQDFIRIGQYQI